MYFGRSFKTPASIVPASVPVHRWHAAEAASSAASSASCYSRLENVLVLAVVEPPRKLIQIERQILLAHVVVRADDAALEQRPERFKIVGVDVTSHVFASLVINGLMRKFHRLEPAISAVFVRRDESNFVGHNLAHEAAQRPYVRVLDHLAYDVAFASYSANDDVFTSVSRTTTMIFRPNLGVAILLLPADVRFIGFHFPVQLGFIVAEHCTDAMADIEGSLVRSRPAVLFEHALDLQGADSLLRLANQIDDLEPDGQRIIGVLEYRSDQSGKAIAVFLMADLYFAGFLVQGFRAALTYPSPVLLCDLKDLGIAASDATNAVRPTHLDQQSHAGVLSIVLFVNLSKAQHAQTLHHSDAWCQVRYNRQDFHPHYLIA
jgi:hypothetical protein